MNPGLPLLLDVTGRRVLVVGAGTLAARRIPALVEAGAVVDVVAPLVHELIEGMAQGGSLVVHRRPFIDADIDRAWLVLALTDDAQVNAGVAALAEARRLFCVRGDRGGGGSARTPASVRRGPLVVSVNASDDPARAGALRDAIAGALDVGDLASYPARRARMPGAGHVALVGGGPGDPELITVRGRRLVSEADVVVVDRLAPRALLDELPDAVEIVDCGKSAHRHNLSQQQINEVLIERARRGLRVVRLKGGDPYVYGRGGEELLACRSAGIDVEVVPGLSSVLAAPSLAGIPLTHRGVAADFAVVSGHLDPDRPRDGGLDWPALATGPDTVVMLMAMDRLGEIARTLIAHGRAGQTPAAVVRAASMPEQLVVRAPLAQIGDAALRAGVGAPAVVIVGAVAGLTLR